MITAELISYIRKQIQNNVSIYDNVTLEDDVFCGPSMVFTNVYNPRSHVVRKHEYKKTIVRTGATIGANATVVCGVELGEYSFIGAGSVVKSDVKPYAIMVGVPARHIGWMCKCGVKLHFNSQHQAICGCGLEYVLQNASCVPA